MRQCPVSIRPVTAGSHSNCNLIGPIHIPVELQLYLPPCAKGGACKTSLGTRPFAWTRKGLGTFELSLWNAWVISDQ